MPLKLIPPGKRKGNRFYLIRGEVGGRRLEVSAKTTDETAALRLKAELELRILADRVPGSGEEVTFGRGADLYVARRGLLETDDDWRRIEKLRRVLGARRVADIRQADLEKAARDLYPGRAPATLNREALRPAAAILHYCADNEYCPWLRVKLFKEPRPKTRAVTQDVARALINSVPELPAFERRRSARYLAAAAERQRRKALLLLWLFRQGTRISDALKIEGTMIDLERRTVSRHIGKTDEHVEEPLHDEVWEMLANDPPGPGRLFPWSSRRSVYRWLKPYCESLGIRFTPHMARHSLGKWLNEDGASLRTIMDTLHHKDVKSSARYQSTDIEVIRATGRRLGKLRGAKDA